MLLIYPFEVRGVLILFQATSSRHKSAQQQNELKSRVSRLTVLPYVENCETCKILKTSSLYGYMVG